MLLQVDDVSRETSSIDHTITYAILGQYFLRMFMKFNRWQEIARLELDLRMFHVKHPIWSGVPGLIHPQSDNHLVLVQVVSRETSQPAE